MSSEPMSLWKQLQSCDSSVGLNSSVPGYCLVTISRVKGGRAKSRYQSFYEVLKKRGRKGRRKGFPCYSHQIVLSQVELQYSVFNGCKHKTNILRICK